MCQYSDVECTLATCVLHDAEKHRCEHHGGVNCIKIRLKARCHAISSPRLVVKYAIEGVPVCDVVLKATEEMIAEFAIHALVNVI